MRSPAPGGRRGHGQPVGHQVHPVTLGNPGGDQLADGRPGHAAHGRGPVHFRRLVGRPAEISPAAEILLQEHLDHLADAVRGPLGHQLVGQPGQVVHPPGDLGRIELGAQGGRLGALLVGVAEDTDRVEPRLGQETLQLIDVGGGLAREADDEVATGRQPPGRPA